MTLNEIRDDVAALGFEGEIALSSAFTSALQRALGTVYTERGVYARLRLYQSMPRPSVYVDTIEHVGGECDTVALCCRSYSFEVFGDGYCTIRDDDGERTINFSGDGRRVSGRCTLNAVISFEGEFRYTVCHLSGFSEAFPTDEEIPICNVAVEYPLYKIAGGMLSVVGCAKDGRGVAIKGAEISSGVLRVPYGYRGEINVTYRKRPPEVYTDTPDAELDIDPECSHLLALLTAAYVWLDDDPDKAQYYMSLYRDGMAAVKLYGGMRTSTEYHDVTGWA